jgi:hypothetical protein
MGGTIAADRRSFWLRLAAVLAPGVVGAIVLFAGPPLPQSQGYHHFADQRTFLGVPNCLNVVSNLPFLVVGLLGLRGVLRRDAVGPDRPFLTAPERWPYVVFFLGVGLTAFGSAYYHLDPTNTRLVWDRLPIAVTFMALFAAILGERLGVSIGRHLLLPLVLLGIGTVVYWDAGERLGHGDLRPYYVVQFYPMLAIPLLLLLFPPRYTGTAGLFAAVGWYGLAKVLEHLLDAPLYQMFSVSGHTLKHLSAACGAYAILRMVQLRRPTPPNVG